MFRQQQRAVLGFAALVVAGLSGCAIMDSHERVAGWPELKIIEHHVSNQEMRDMSGSTQPATTTWGRSACRPS